MKLIKELLTMAVKDPMFWFAIFMLGVLVWVLTLDKGLTAPSSDEAQLRWHFGQ